MIWTQSNLNQNAHVAYHFRVFLNTTCWGNPIKLSVPFGFLWLTKTTSWHRHIHNRSSIRKAPYFGFHCVRSASCRHLAHCSALCSLNISYLFVDKAQIAFAISVSLCINCSTGLNFDTNQDDLSAFASKSFPLQKEKRFNLLPISDQIANHRGWYPLWEKSSSLAGSCILSLLHAAINSSSIQAGDCSHFPPLPLQPSLHDNGDLRHQAGERYDMWAAC